MNIVIAAIGRARSGPEQALFDTYAGRLPWKIDVKELEIKKELAADVRRAREGELLLGAIPDGARVVALDERGKNEGSAAFATRLGRWRDDGVRTVAFLIGVFGMSMVAAIIKAMPELIAAVKERIAK